MKKKISLKDIAQKVGVSTALVSYVLNNKKEGRIGKEIAQRIKDTARELNYRTNQIAKSLKTNKTNTIGLIVADISNPFFSSLARIIEDEAEKNNYTVIFGSSDECAQKSGRLIDVLLNHQVDGLIIAPADNTADQILSLQQNEVPFVLLDRYFPDIKTSYVAVDNYKAALNSVNYLIKKGLTQIGFVTYQSNLYNLQQRKKGYADALQQHKIRGKKSWVKELELNSTTAEIKKAVEELLTQPQPVNAIVFASNTLSTHGLKYINTLALKVPDDVAILSFDESDAADLFYAPLTHIKQPLLEMGKMATRILLESIGKNNKVTQVNMEAELVISKSTMVQPDVALLM